LTLTRKFAAVLAAALVGAAAAAFLARAQLQSTVQPQTQTTPVMNRNVVVLDPAHGGADGGILLGDHIYEKDVTLELATKLRAALTSAGFTVVMTHDSDSFDPLTTDQRAELANRARAVACIVIHASNSGSGVHLYTSALQPPTPESTYDYWPGARQSFTPTPWDSAQAEFVNLSRQMVGNLNASLGTAHLPSLVGHEPVRPLNNLTCPAIALELAPLPVADGNAVPVTDSNYQMRVTEALTAVLMSWRDQVAPPTTAATVPTNNRPPAGNPSAQSLPAATTPAQATDLARAAAKATAAAEASGSTAARYHTSVGVRGVAPSSAHSSTSERISTGTHATSPEIE
jgi:N-acetylmuramoyl-L-alanine amidase